MDTLTEGHMPKRMTSFVPAILVILFAVVALAARPGTAESAADECVTKHGSEAPDGSHWYYRIDRANNRRCWFLGPVDNKMRTRQSTSQQPVPAAKPTAPATVDGPADIAPVQVAAAQAQVAPAQVSNVRVAAVKVTTDQVTAAEVAFAEAASSNDKAPAVSNPTPISNADSPSPPQTRDDTSVVGPNPAATVPSESEPAIGIELLLACLAGALGLAALIAERLVRRSARRGRGQSDLNEQSGAPAKATRPHEHAAFARAVTPPRQADIVRKPVVAATRRASAAHDQPSDAGYDIEERLQRLLRDWQRTAA
jgi:hypothetical protein